MTVMTQAEAEAALADRKANPPERVNNARLPAGSPMYYYCKSCGHLSCVLPESWTTGYKKFCDPCMAMIKAGWLTE